jgi:peroxiredoxin
MPNDTATHREDSFDNMKAFAAKHGFTFPYVIDETQEVAHAYGAQCTPRAVQRSLLNLMEKMDLRPPSAAA